MTASEGIGVGSSGANAAHWGAFTAARTADGRLVTEPAKFDPAPSGLLRSIPATVRHANRIARPSVRTGWLAGDGGAGRGKDPFVEMSWAEVLDRVADELTRVRDTFGNESIFAGSYGWASAGRYHHPKSQLNRLLSLIGGYTGHIGTYSFGAAATTLPHVIGHAAASVGAGVDSSWDTIVANTELIVAFGGMPLRCAQVNPGGMGQHSTQGWIDQLVTKGIQCVNISPLRGDLMDDLHAEWIAPRPGTDVAIMLGLAHTLLIENLYDRQFVDKYCSGFRVLRDYLTGRRDGHAKTAQWASTVAGVSAESIVRLARRMAANRTLISTAWALQRAEHGEQTYWATVALAALVGQIGVPGGGFGFAYGIGIMGARPPRVSGPTLPKLPNPAQSAIPVARIADMLLNPGSPYEFNGAMKTYPDARLIYWVGGNPFHHHQDINRLIGAWRRPETIVVHDPWWTATARFSDIVLPATTTLERNDLGYGNQDRFIFAMKKVIEPVGEARDDVVIFADLARRLGVASEFSEGRDEFGWLEFLYERVRRAAAEQRIDLPEFAQFWARGVVELPASDEPLVVLSDFRRDPAAHPLTTPSGRIELFSPTVADFGYDDCPGHPAWFEPTEWLGSSLAERFPLHLLTHQPAHRLHAQLDQGPVSAESKVAGREPCRISPEDARLRGIADGDVVRIFNERGACLAGAVISEEVRPGVLAIATGAWYDPVEWGVPGSLDKHGNPNVLTLDRGTSRLAQGSSAQTALVEVERFVGAAPPVTAHQPPRVITA